MSFLRTIASGLRSLFSRERAERELDEELNGFLEMSIDEKMFAQPLPRENNEESAVRPAPLWVKTTARIEFPETRSPGFFAGPRFNFAAALILPGRGSTSWRQSVPA
jgi:hypothetical protein